MGIFIRERFKHIFFTINGFSTNVYTIKYSAIHVLLLLAFGCAFQLKIIVIIGTTKFC